MDLRRNTYEKNIIQNNLLHFDRASQKAEFP